MNRTLTRIGVMTSAALLVAAAPAAAHTPDPDPDTTVTFTLYGVGGEETLITAEGDVFVDEEGLEVEPSVGDRFVTTDELYEDAERTELVGRNHIDCTITEVVGELPTDEQFENIEDLDLDELEYFRLSFTCSGVVEVFGQGTLTWGGVVSFSLDDLIEEIEFGEELPEAPFITVAITGGTDELIGATGQAELFDEEAPTEDEIWTRYEVTLL
jgi:hypothetical protein